MLILLWECGVGIIAAITTFVLQQGFLLEQVSSSASLLKKHSVYLGCWRLLWVSGKPAVVLTFLFAQGHFLIWLKTLK